MPKHKLAYVSLDEIPTLTAAKVATTDVSLLFDTSDNQFVKTEAVPKGRSKLVPAGSTITLTDAHWGDTILADTLAGSTINLPQFTGSGGKIDILVSVVATSNSHKIQTFSGDVLYGIIYSRDDTSDNAVAFSGQDQNTITLNRSTTGSVNIGETITVTDFAVAKGAVLGFVSNTGVPATPFSKA